MNRIALIGVIVLAVGTSLRAENVNNAKALVDDLFGSRIKQAQASTSRLDDVALAKQMVDAAKAATDKASLLTELCTRAGTLAAKHSSGYATANEAYLSINKTDGHWYIHGKANSGFYVYVTTVEGLTW